MKTNFYRIVLLSICLTALPGCSQVSDFVLGYEDSSTETPTGRAALDYIRNEMPERSSYGAELLAMYYSRQLIAPENLYQMFASDGRKIARLHGTDEDLIAYLPGFNPPWTPGEFYLSVDTLTCKAMKAGEYHAWDELNEAVGVKDIRYSRFMSDGFTHVSFTINPRLHPLHVGRMYGELPGIRWGGPSSSFGDNGESLVLFGSDSRLYMYRWGRGDCECGCIYNTWSITLVNDEGAEHLARWEGRDTGEWTDEIEAAREEYSRCAHLPE